MIAVDWGTTSFRAYRLGAAGAIVEQRRADAGLLSCGGRFAEVLAQQLDGWDDAVVVMAGMVGSRSGWREVPYVPCPAGFDEIAAGLSELDADAMPGRRVFIVPGVSQRREGAQPDVMRGEETQVLGVLDQLSGDGPHVLCLPGTHSKWVRVERGRIVELRTAMTGELYALMRRHSLLAASMPASVDDDVDDADAFARGIDAAAGEGGLLHHLFGVRTRGLFGDLDARQAPSFLSGLLVGHELRALMPPGVKTVHLIGGAALRARYERALRAAGVAVHVHAEDCVARGLAAMARACGSTDV